MMEIVAVLFIFFVLLLLGIVFYYQYQKGAIKEEREEILAEEVVDLSLRASFLPELVCSEGGYVKGNCIDLEKLEITMGVIKENLDYYFDIFKRSKIIIEEIEPGERNWILYDQSGNLTSRLPVSAPVSLYNSTEKQYYFGVLRVEYYYKK